MHAPSIVAYILANKQMLQISRYRYSSLHITELMPLNLLPKNDHTTCISFTGTLGPRQEPSYRRTNDHPDRCGRDSAAPRSNSVMQETASRAMHILVFLAQCDRVYVNVPVPWRRTAM